MLEHVRRLTTLKPTINLSILESKLHRCQWMNQFKQILSQMILTGYITDTYAASRLVNFSTHSNFIPFQYSLKIFDHLHNPNTFIWNTIMRSHLELNNSPHQALNFYRLVNFSTHSNFIPFQYSLKIFDHLHNPNTFIWNTILRSHLELNNSPHQALNFYRLFLFQNTSPDHYTYPILLRSCTARVSEPEGKQIHDHVVKFGFDSDVYVRNTLINLYAVCGNMMSARKVFKESLVLDLVSWNTLLAGYINSGDVGEAECVYDKMPVRNTIASNSMIVLFGKEGCVAKARSLFDRIEGKDMVSWNTLLSGYVDLGDVVEKELCV